MTTSIDKSTLCGGCEFDVALENSFNLQIKADALLRFSSQQQLIDFACSEYVARGGRFMVLGGGNNVLFRGDYHGVVLMPEDRSIDVIAEDGNDVLVRVGAALEWDDFVAWSVTQQLWGVENLSLIPGFVGASPIQNIGAYGVEVSHTIDSVEVFDMESRKVRNYEACECQFGYRESIFKHQLKGRAVVLSVTFRLKRNADAHLGYGDLEREVALRGGATLENIREAVIAIRRDKLPDKSELGSAGSFFKNPIVPKEIAQRLLEQYEGMPVYKTEEQESCKLAAGWLIDKTGLKGVRDGAVGVHTRQALVLVNYGGATGEQIVRFAEMVAERVYDKFSIRLEFEVNIID